MYTASIYFMGQYRPAYFEADTARKAVAKAIRAIPDCEHYRMFARWLNTSLDYVGPNCTSWSADWGGYGVSLVSRKHDPFLDSVTRDFPAYPGLDYTNAANR